jgi:excisionase family DNA binding protein
MLLTKKQAAARLNVCTDTLLTLTAKGAIIGFKVGSQWRFDERDINGYIDRQRQQSARRTAARNTKTRMRRPRIDCGIIPVWEPGMRITDVIQCPR